MSRNNDASGALAALIVIIAIIIGFAVYQKVTELAEFMGTDFDTAWSVVVRSAIFIAILLAGFFTGHIKKLVPYIPFCCFLVITPILTYKASAHSSGIYQLSEMAEAAWYGGHWTQVVIGLVLFSAGAFWQWKQGEFD